MLNEQYIHPAPISQDVTPDGHSALAAEIAGQLQTGKPKITQRARWKLADLFRELDEPEFAELVKQIYKCLLLVSGSSDRGQREKLRKQILQATGCRLGRFIPCGRQQEWVPSLEQISAACAEIRKTWTKAERKARWAMPTRWTVPQVRMGRAGR